MGARCVCCLRVRQKEKQSYRGEERKKSEMEHTVGCESWGNERALLKTHPVEKSPTERKVEAFRALCHLLYIKHSPLSLSKYKYLFNHANYIKRLHRPISKQLNESYFKATPTLQKCTILV